MTPTRVSAAILVLFLVIPLCSAISVSLSSPPEVKFNEPFSVTISADTQDTYDVKIYVKNSSDTILSDIQNDTWKSSMYYVNNAFPSKTSFSIKVDKFSEPAEICIKLRLSEKRSSPPTPEKCNSIKIIQSQDVSEPEQENNTPPNKTNNDSQSKTIPDSSSAHDLSQDSTSQNAIQDTTTSTKSSKKNTSANNPQTIISSNEINNLESINSDINSEVITLSSKQANTTSASNSYSYISPQQKTRLLALYALTFIVLVVVLLAMLKRI